MDEAISDSKSHAPSKESKEKFQATRQAKTVQMRSIPKHGTVVGMPDRECCGWDHLYLRCLSSTLSRLSMDSTPVLKRYVYFYWPPPPPCNVLHYGPPDAPITDLLRSSGRITTVPPIAQSSPPCSTPTPAPSPLFPFIVSPCTADPSVWVGSLCSSLV